MNKTLEKPKITLEEVKDLYTQDMKKYGDTNYIDFHDYCKEIEILFEITY